MSNGLGSAFLTASYAEPDKSRSLLFIGKYYEFIFMINQTASYLDGNLQPLL